MSDFTEHADKVRAMVDDMENALEDYNKLRHDLYDVLIAVNDITYPHKTLDEKQTKIVKNNISLLIERIETFEEEYCI